MTTTSYRSRAELEISRVWEREHPDLAQRGINDFLSKHRDWNIYVDLTRNGFITYIAVNSD